MVVCVVRSCAIMHHDHSVRDADTDNPQDIQSFNGWERCGLKPCVHVRRMLVDVGADQFLHSFRLNQ